MGFKFDIIKFVGLNPISPYAGESSFRNGLPAAFLKFGILFADKLEFELDGGYQLGDKFSGGEASFLVKYRVWENIFPFAAYFMHANDGHEGTGTGISRYTYNLLGGGVEWKLSKLFSVDLGYYYPVGEKGYDYEYLSSRTSDFKYTNTTEINSLVRLGISFSFYP